MNNLTLVAIERNKKWMATLPQNPPKAEFSEKHMKEMNKILDKMRGDRYHRFTRKTTKIIFVAAALITALSVTVFATIDLGAYILEELRDHAIFQSLFTSEESVGETIECGYIPEGFEVAMEDCAEHSLVIVYRNDIGEHFSIFKIENGYEVGLDNEYTKKSVAYISNAEVVIYEKENNDIRAVWCNGYYTYRIDGNISYNEVINIAEYVK